MTYLAPLIEGITILETSHWPDYWDPGYGLGVVSWRIALTEDWTAFYVTSDHEFVSLKSVSDTEVEMWTKGMNDPFFGGWAKLDRYMVKVATVGALESHLFEGTRFVAFPAPTISGAVGIWLHKVGAEVVRMVNGHIEPVDLNPALLQPEAP